MYTALHAQNALNALDAVTYDIDQACGTTYHERFNKYLLYSQKYDLVANCAQTDVKGSRNPKYKRAHMQPDPDQFVHVVKTNVDGVGIDGKPCKGIIVRERRYVTPMLLTSTKSSWHPKLMGKGDESYAVSFALPADWDGVKLMALPGLHHKRTHLKAPLQTSVMWSPSPSSTTSLSRRKGSS